MKNLMTRKIVLGMLMTLVLAFSVQGIAGAQTVARRSSDDLEYRFPNRNQTVNISFSVSDVNTGHTLDIPVPAGFTLTRVGSSTITGGTTSTLPLKETLVTTTDPPDQSYQKLRNGSYSLTYRVDDANADAHVITIGGVEFTIYVVTLPTTPPTIGREDEDGPYFIGTKGILGLSDIDEGAFTGSGNVMTQVTAFNPITYEVSGPGRVYVKVGTGAAAREGPRSSRLTTAGPAPIWIDMNGGTNVVKVQTHVEGISPDPASFTVIFAYPELKKVPDDGPKQVGATGGRLDSPFVVQLVDAKGRSVAGQDVSFTAGTGATLVADPAIDDERVTVTSGTEIDVETDSSGRAGVYLVLGDTAQDYDATATFGTATAMFTATAEDAKAASSIGIVSGNGQRSDQYGVVKDPLVVVVRDQRGRRLINTADNPVMVTFNAIDGGELDVPSGVTDSNDDPAIAVIATNSSGEASVTYTLPPDASGRRVVRASINNAAKWVDFNINGSGSTGGVRDPPRNPRLDISIPTTSAPAGQDVVVSATLLDADGVRERISGIPVTFSASSGSFSLQSADTNGVGTASSTLTLPSSATVVTITVDSSGYDYDLDRGTITVTAPAADDDDEEADTGGIPSRLLIDGDEDIEGELNSREELVVQVVDSNGDGVVGSLVIFRVTDGNGRLSPARARTDSAGFADVGFTPRSDGTIEVEASSGDLSPVYFFITTGEPPSAITKVSGDNQSGRPGAALANPFVVEVIDENDDPVSGVTVTFAVTAGGGTLSAESATTNSNGRTQTTLTLGSEPGDNTVAARVTGITGVTFKATSGAQVLVRAAQRPPMYWVGKANGTLHRLVDAETENLAPNVQGVTSIAVDSANGLLYFAVQTGANKGTIRRAGLNGAGAQTLKKLTAVPMGIAVDSAGGTVYWTNSRGRIQSIATEGSTQLTNVLQNLSSPGPIALSNGYLYWGESLGRVRRMSVTAAQAAPENIATGLGEPLSIAIAKGKIYWVERGAGGGGSLQRANLNGANIEELKTFASGVPTSIVVDSSDNKIYLTKGTGKIQRSNLMGRFVKDIATGLMNPGSIALGAAAVEEEPVVEQPTRQTRRTQTPQTDNSKYDVNGDGAVDNIDVTLVAVALGSSNAKYDVNGDGSVDANDLRAVIANTDDDAGAPAIDVDLTGLNLDADRIQEQIELLIASGDISLAGQRTLAYLQNLLTALRPDETVLLANYPNPFNPETWIPYHLADSTDVKVNIYNAQGVLVRALTLGHQSAGYYTSRSRAAYWDGRNALGERVASGLYFYQLQTDEISPMRKMVILK